MSPSNSWYQVVGGPGLQQGDLLRSFLIVKPPRSIEVAPDGVPQPSPLKVEAHNVVVLTQSCDLEHNKTGTVLICPYFPLSAVDTPRAVRQDPDRLIKFHEQVRRGYQPPLHMLAATAEDGLEHEIQVVDFRLVAIASVSYARSCAAQAGRRLRLNSPYVEHLSQAFARFFMRVGLPSDIPSFGRLP